MGRGVQAGMRVLALAHAAFIVACASGSATDPNATECGATALAPESLQGVLSHYARDVHPLFLDGEAGCASCHALGSGRAFVVTTDAAETFHRARASRFWGSGGATILSKLTNPNPAARMPLGRPAWNSAAIKAVHETACAVAAYERLHPEPIDEMFPPALLQPWGGPRTTELDVPVLSFPQLKGKVATLFGDSWVRGGRDLFAANIAAFGGVDFAEHRVERTRISAEYLLGLDALSADVCSQAASRRAGPFESFDPTSPQVTAADIGRVYDAMLFRPPDAREVASAESLLRDLLTLGRPPADAWSGLCEALFKHPDFIFALPPSTVRMAGRKRERLVLVRAAQDLMARPPNPVELGQFDRRQKSLSQLVDQFLASPEFREYYFYKMRVRASSDGSATSDEPARLWTYLATLGRPFSELFTGDYSVSTRFVPVARGRHHGKTGLLTMKGFLKTKPGLPHFNYPARVLSDFMGAVFEVPAEVLNLRDQRTAESTVDPTSVCYTCHQLLTPLAHQRLRWRDDGTYSERDDQGNVIDDSDRGLVSTYPYKGQGLEAFSLQAAKKEAFIRSTLNAQMMFLTGRPLRAEQDERTLYKQLWDVSQSSNQDLRAILKALILSPTYQQDHTP